MYIWIWTRDCPCTFLDFEKGVHLCSLGLMAAWLGQLSTCWEILNTMVCFHNCKVLNLSIRLAIMSTVKTSTSACVCVCVYFKHQWSHRYERGANNILTSMSSLWSCFDTLRNDLITGKYCYWSRLVHSTIQDNLAEHFDPKVFFNKYTTESELATNSSAGDRGLLRHFLSSIPDATWWTCTVVPN